MSPLKTPKNKQIFNGMAQCYHCFIPNVFWELNIGTKNSCFSPTKMRTQMVHTKFGSHQNEGQDTETNMEVDSRPRDVARPFEMV